MVKIFNCTVRMLCVALDEVVAFDNRIMVDVVS
jgi:hypothetical protein